VTSTVKAGVWLLLFFGALIVSACQIPPVAPIFLLRMRLNPSGLALINNTGPGHDNDLIWEPNATNLPPAGCARRSHDYFSRTAAQTVTPLARFSGRDERLRVRDVDWPVGPIKAGIISEPRD
jgi:hypothetical protein